MQSCHIAEIVTPKKFLLNGLWFGPKKPKRVIILTHGLTASAFSRLPLVEKLVDADTAMMTFNGRGHDIVTFVSQVVGKKKKSILAGTAHERFEDCVDDLAGAVAFAKKMGAKDVYLAGHSTGCQKSVYYVSRTKKHGVKGIILLAPLSDYAGVFKRFGKKKIDSLLRYAREQIKKGKGNDLIPSSLWNEEPVDSYRFLSLYTPDSVEQSIFPYFDEDRSAKIFSSIRVPVLAFFMGEDEYADRPPEQLADWFERHASTSQLQTLIVPGATHSFRGEEAKMARAIKAWIHMQ